MLEHDVSVIRYDHSLVQVTSSPHRYGLSSLSQLESGRMTYLSDEIVDVGVLPHDALSDDGSTTYEVESRCDDNEATMTNQDGTVYEDWLKSPPESTTSNARKRMFHSPIGQGYVRS